jgi:hypothetical protein
MSAPVRPPLAESHPCVQCDAGRAVGRKRLCSRCVKANKHSHYVTHREEIRELKRRIARLEDVVAALGFGCAPVAEAKGARV